MENPITIDDLGVPLFSETPICSISVLSISWDQLQGGNWGAAVGGLEVGEVGAMKKKI